MDDKIEVEDLDEIDLAPTDGTPVEVFFDDVNGLRTIANFRDGRWHAKIMGMTVVVYPTHWRRAATA
jgi:hypothetical protein